MSHITSLLKAISWRFLGTAISAGIVLLLTHTWALSLAFAGIEVIAKIIAYYIHERIWIQITK